jgi:hypothetical protein
VKAIGVLMMNGTVRARTRRLVQVYLVVNALAFLFWAGYAAFLVYSGDDRISLSGGDPVQRMFWYAVGSTLFTTASFGFLLLLAGILVAVAVDVKNSATASN